VKSLNWRGGVAIALAGLSGLAALMKLISRADGIGFDKPVVQIGFILLGGVILGLAVLLIAYRRVTKRWLPAARERIIADFGPGCAYLIRRSAGTERLLRQASLNRRGLLNTRPAIIALCNQEGMTFWIGVRNPQRFAALTWAQVKGALAWGAAYPGSGRPALVLRTSDRSSVRRLRLILVEMRANGRLVPASLEHFDAFTREFRSRGVSIVARTGSEHA
jgi:hypothetical protein